MPASGRGINLRDIHAKEDQYWLVHYHTYQQIPRKTNKPVQLVQCQLRVAIQVLLQGT